MPNPRLAKRYAKSLLDLAKEKDQVEPVYADMQWLQAVVRESRDFLNLLRSPVVKADKKNKIIDAVTAGKISGLTAAFMRLLVNKGRESNLPEVIEAYIEQYKQFRHIHTVTLTTATPIDDAVRGAIVE